MDKIYFFNSHGSRNDINTRVQMNKLDNNIYISLAYPGYPITSYELVVCLQAFKNNDFIKFWTEQINNLDQLESFEQLYRFERNIEMNMIQSGWKQINNYVGSDQESNLDPDYNLIIHTQKYMEQFVRPDGMINIDLYKIDSAFFLTFYFSNDKFNLTLPDYNYSTHIYSATEVQRSGLNPLSTYNYNLSVSPGEKFSCDQDGKTKINRMVKKCTNILYSQLKMN